MIKGLALPRFRLLKPLQRPFRFGKMEPKRNTVIRIVNTRANNIQTEPTCIKLWLENESKQIMNV